MDYPLSGYVGNEKASSWPPRSFQSLVVVLGKRSELLSVTCPMRFAAVRWFANVLWWTWEFTRCTCILLVSSVWDNPSLLCVTSISSSQTVMSPVESRVNDSS